MKQIKDPVHGYIYLPDCFIENLVDTEHFQRLRNLKQLSATNMVYPAANHTRFEHSLGVCHLARKALGSVKRNSRFQDGVDVDEIENTLLSAALLHDIGHPPFSHIGEGLLDRDDLIARLTALGFVNRLDEAGIRTGLGSEDPLEDEGKHELLSCIVVLEEYSDVLTDEIGVDPFEVCGYILGISLKGERDDEWQHKVAADVLSSPVDVDRLDYITRDNYMSGADVSNIDTKRMVDSYTTCQGSLTLSDKALSTISNYLEGRISVYMWITQHHKSVYANALLRELLRELDGHMERDLFSTEKILESQIGDSYVLQKLREFAEDSPDSRLNRLYSRFMKREFMNSCWKHKMAYQNDIHPDVRDDFFLDVDSNKAEVQSELIAELGLEEDDLWVELSYVPHYQPSELRNIHISYDDEKKSVSEFGLYEEREYPGPTPYIFAPPECEADICDVINEAYA